MREQLDLVAAVQHTCDCTYTREGGSLTMTCSAHTMLAQDQRALDGTLWSRRIVKRLLIEEGIFAR
jgi:hypothetical protein